MVHNFRRNSDNMIDTALHINFYSQILMVFLLAGAVACYQYAEIFFIVVGSITGLCDLAFNMIVFKLVKHYLHHFFESDLHTFRAIVENKQHRRIL